MENVNGCRCCGSELPPGMVICSARCFWAYEEKVDEYLFASAHKPHDLERRSWQDLATEIMFDPWHRDAYHAMHKGLK